MTWCMFSHKFNFSDEIMILNLEEMKQLNTPGWCLFFLTSAVFLFYFLINTFMNMVDIVLLLCLWGAGLGAGTRERLGHHMGL